MKQILKEPNDLNEIYLQNLKKLTPNIKTFKDFLNESDNIQKTIKTELNAIVTRKYYEKSENIIKNL